VNENPTAASTAMPLRPLSPSYRWLVLAVIRPGMFGNYYVFDALNPVGPLLESQLHFTQSQIGLLDTAYNVAALLVPARGRGHHRPGRNTQAVALFGSIAFSRRRPDQPLADVRRDVRRPVPVWRRGRAAHRGHHDGPRQVVQGKELAFAMGLNLTVARLGSVAADNSRTWASPLFSSWQPPLVLAAAIGVVCLASALGTGYSEARAERREVLGRAGETDRLVFADLVKFGGGLLVGGGLCVTFYSTVFPFRRFANIFFTHVHG